MHIGLITFELSGHLNPMTTLGAALAKRGHRVTLLGGRAAQPFAERAGIDFTCLGDSDGLDRQLTEMWRELGRLSGIASMRQTGRVLAATSRMILRDAPVAIAGTQLDAMLVDQFTPAGVVVAGQFDLPFVVVCNALAGHWDPYSPPPPMPWRYRRDWIGRLRTMLATRLVPPLYDWVADAKATGVRPLQLVFEFEHGLAQIAQQPKFFDFPVKMPNHFHYTAPWHRADRDDDLDFPWERLDGRPLIYASMGTLQNNLPRVFQAIADAVRGMDVQMVLTQGGSAAEFDLDLPDNVLLVRSAPQLRLLDRAALAITHAGLNTALECVARGVPMVCIPVTNDQPGVSRRVEWLGLGEVLRVGRVAPIRLRRLIQQVLQQPRYRLAARQYQAQIKDCDGPAMAADIVLRAFESGRPVHLAESNACEERLA